MPSPMKPIFMGFLQMVRVILRYRVHSIKEPPDSGMHGALPI